MATISERTEERRETDSSQAQAQRVRSLASQDGRVVLRFLELQIPMVLGALVCYLLGLLVPASSSFATVYHPGTYLFAIGDVLYLTIPVVAWMVFHGHGWRVGTAMGIAMVAPVAVIIVLGWLTEHSYLLWLITGMYPLMCLGMLVHMLYRREHFTGGPKAHVP